MESTAGRHPSWPSASSPTISAPGSSASLHPGPPHPPNAGDVETIDAAARAADLNPLLLFACIGAEQPWDLRAAYTSDWRAYAGNPFDIAVYGAWHPTGYTLAQSAAIAARTLATRLLVAPPGDEPALAWIDDPPNPAGQGGYATEPHWRSNVASISELLVPRAAADAGGTLAAPTLQALATYALTAATTPDAVAQALALRVRGPWPGRGSGWPTCTGTSIRTPALWQPGSWRRRGRHWASAWGRRWSTRWRARSPRPWPMWPRRGLRSVLGRRREGVVTNAAIEGIDVA